MLSEDELCKLGSWERLDTYQVQLAKIEEAKFVHSLIQLKDNVKDDYTEALLRMGILYIRAGIIENILQKYEKTSHLDGVGLAD